MELMFVQCSAEAGEFGSIQSHFHLDIDLSEPLEQTLGHMLLKHVHSDTYCRFCLLWGYAPTDDKHEYKKN